MHNKSPQKCTQKLNTDFNHVTTGPLFGAFSLSSPGQPLFYLSLVQTSTSYWGGGGGTLNAKFAFFFKNKMQQDQNSQVHSNQFLQNSLKVKVSQNLVRCHWSRWNDQVLTWFVSGDFIQKFAESTKACLGNFARQSQYLCSSLFDRTMGYFV